MKLGMVLAIRNHPQRPYPLAEVYADYIEDAVYADQQLNFDHLWVNEHHLSIDAYAPSAFITMAAIAAKTKNIRLGSAVCCLPFHNPLRIAEDAATLDIISGGRLDMAVGVGSSPHEYKTFDTPRSEAWKRSWESAEFIRRTFVEEQFDFDGEFYKFEEVTQTTKPVQSPPPMWWGGFGPQSMRRAAQRGFHVLACAAPEYDRALLELGKPLDKHEVAQVCAIHVAESLEQAWDEAQYGLHWFMNFHRVINNIPAGGTDAGPLEQLPPPEKLREVEGLTFMPGIPIYIGTPDSVREQLLAVCRGEKGRITQLAFHFRHAGMRTPEVRRSMELFRTEILPHIPRDVTRPS